MKVERILLSGVMALTILFSVSAPARAEYFQDALLTYRHGEYPEAFTMFMKLAKEGDARAQFWIGTMWYHGKGQPQNYREAFRWYLRSAYLGNADSQNNLGLIYKKGEAQPINPVVAYAWFSLAAAQNNDIARINLDDLTEELKQAHRENAILEGQALAQEYLARIGAAKPTLVNTASLPSSTTMGMAGGMAGAPRPLASGAAPVPRRDVADAQEVFMVQLGLFENAANIQHVRHEAHAHGLKVEDDAVEIRGRTYERFRFGPYPTAQAASAMVQKVDTLFGVKSVVIPLLR